MRMLFNAAAVSVCVLLAVGGCQGGKKETPKAINETKATEQKSAAAASVTPSPAAAPAPGVPAPVVSAPVPAPETPKPAGEQPKIKFANTLVDLGDIKPDSKNDANYTFTNVGKVNLKVLDVQKTCGCTVPELIKRDYAPGESGTIKVTYQATKIAGPVVKHLYVMTDDPNNSRVEIALKANVVVPIEVEPKTMQLRLDTPEANVPTITLYSKDGKPFSIKSVETSSPISVATDPNVKASRFVVKLKIDNEKLKDNPSGAIKFNVVHPDIDMLVVTYNTLAEFDLQPPSLIVRSAAPKQSETRELWVKNNYNKPFEIESVVSKNGDIKLLKQEKIENMYKLTIEITAPEIQKAMFFSDTLMINIKNGKPLEVVCRGFFRRINVGEKHDVK